MSNNYSLTDEFNNIHVFPVHKHVCECACVYMNNYTVVLGIPVGIEQ